MNRAEARVLSGLLEERDDDCLKIVSGDSEWWTTRIVVAEVDCIDWIFAISPLLSR